MLLKRKEKFVDYVIIFCDYKSYSKRYVGIIIEYEVLKNNPKAVFLNNSTH